MVLPFFNFIVSGQHSEDKKQRQTGRIPYFFITAFLLLTENESCCLFDAFQAQKDFPGNILPQSQIQKYSRIRMTYSWRSATIGSTCGPRPGRLRQGSYSCTEADFVRVTACVSLFPFASWVNLEMLPSASVCRTRFPIAFTGKSGQVAQGILDRRR